MAGRADPWIVASVLLASACALAAPLAGRAGFTLAAHALVALAAAAGLASFGVAAAQTLARLRAAQAPQCGKRCEGPGC